MTKNKKKNKNIIPNGRKYNQKSLEQIIARFFIYNPKKEMSPRQIIKTLKIGNSKNSVEKVLTRLIDQHQLSMNAPNIYKINTALKTRKENKSRKHSDKRKGAKNSGRAFSYTGKVEILRSGSAYLIVDGRDDDIFISKGNLGTAVHGDIAKVKTFQRRGRRKLEGEVIEVIERNTKHVVGILSKRRNSAWVFPDGTYHNFEVRVLSPDLQGAEDGDKVVVKITEWPKNTQRDPMGIIETNLGKPGTADAEMNAILINAGFNLKFPQEVLEETKDLNDNIKPKDLASRKDMRSVTTFTIDPLTAKDFDDALSIQKTDKGLEIGVHIADVTHFLKPGTALDKEAYFRSTSVYLVDRVIPMLPEKLSNELCSLRPHEDKFTFSVLFTFDEKFNVINTEITKTLTHSDRRFTYEEAQERIESGEGDYVDEIRLMNSVATKLRKRKFKAGAINFESDEVQFRLDENSKPIEVFVKERKEAHMMIEDFMLLANKEVAKFILKKGKSGEIPFVYRIHDMPNMDKLTEFALFAKEMGVNMDITSEKGIRKSINKLTDLAKEDESLKMLLPMAIRTMSKAAYSPDNIGHFGLAFIEYSHFTSPIRRYADVLAHRILFENLDGIRRVDKTNLIVQTKHISDMERKAIKAERESIKYKQVEYMSEHIGQVFVGQVNGMIDRGVFIEIVENKCEGMLSFDAFDEGFKVEDSRLKAVGTRSKKTLSMGDKILVRIKETDLQRRTIDLEFVDFVEGDEVDK